MKVELRAFIRGINIAVGFFVGLLIGNFVFGLALWILTLCKIGMI